MLNTCGYYDNLLKFIDSGVTYGFIRPEHRQNIIADDNIENLIKRMYSYEPVVMGKWIKDIKMESNGNSQ